ncbi:hypothetical protein Dsin_032174 [Dipteronia sinensis]|uniref:Reverse transcriptase domain-containing protein n=1 Tax=Dipteronia sinensis TaxID=43782 RepID=A0AAD9ZNA8_9ROSI|nr:hypothetical protein Dsin_032174 [Dipteronia sinensis]
MERIVVNYFSGLFSSTNPSGDQWQSVLAAVPTKLSKRRSDFLDSPFIATEVKKAIFDMFPTKAPGIDGMPALFYQKYWDTVGDTVTQACLRCLNNGDPLDKVNQTLIALIPKVQNANRMVDFRPISLCNMTYKIVAKTLANRFRLVLNDVVLESQSAFVPERLISDNAAIGFECLHAIRTLKRKNGSLALKLDMSKANDRVEWGFLSQMMLKLGFSNHWVNIIMSCMTSVSFSFLVNGEVYGLLKPSRGLRQGDPLSPYLFLICAEGLSSLIHRLIYCGISQDSGVGGRDLSSRISHLFFADDSLLFVRASKRNCGTISRILKEYALASRQVINYEKSALCASQSVSISEASVLARSVGVQLVKCHKRYFPTGNFLEAENCSSGSFIWRSLLWGREIIEVGSRWRIGSRSSVLIYSDRWIPRPFSFKIQSPPVLSMDVTVRQLMSPSGGWNIPLVQSSFVFEEADYILSIPIGSSQVHDSLQ